LGIGELNDIDFFCGYKRIIPAANNFRIVLNNGSYTLSIPLANPEASDEKEREKKEKEEKQAKDRSEEKIDVTQTTTCVSSSSRNRPSRTSRLP
jgi:hypothetical protein